MFHYKPYRYIKGENPELDHQFSSAPAFGKVRPAETVIFWKSGLRWYSIPLEQVQRIFRRVEPVYGKLCCGGKSFIIEWLVLILSDGSELVVHIGDEIQKIAEALLQHLKDTQPQIQYGKVYNKPCSET